MPSQCIVTIRENEPQNTHTNIQKGSESRAALCRYFEHLQIPHLDYLDQMVDRWHLDTKWAELCDFLPFILYCLISSVQHTVPLLLFNDKHDTSVKITEYQIYATRASPDLPSFWIS